MPAQEVLARHGRSFWLASLFLGPVRRRWAAQLYAICRTLDDVVDEAPSPREAQLELFRLRSDLQARHPHSPCIRAFVALQNEAGVPKWALLHLMDGLESDLGRVCIQLSLIHI